MSGQIHYVCCEGCKESWSWESGERRTATFHEWYGMLDDILLWHIIDSPDCWAVMVGERGGRRVSLPTEDDPHHG